jgi:hypothetical protein
MIFPEPQSADRNVNVFPWGGEKRRETFQIEGFTDENVFESKR